MRTWQNGDSGAYVKEVIDDNFRELETYIHSIDRKRSGGWFKLFGKNKKLDDTEFRIRKQISGVLSSLNDRAETLLREIDAGYRQIREMLSDNKHTEKLVESQQRTIEVLTNALCDKYKDGLFIYSEDGKIPTVIRNGKELTDDLTQEFSINWCIGEFPNINIEQIAGTHKDMNV